MPKTFDGKTNLSIDLTQEPQQKVTAEGRYLSVDSDRYAIYSTLSVEAADSSINVTEEGNIVKLSVPTSEMQALTFIKNNVSSEYNGASALTVDLASELSAGDGISIADSKINCTLSIGAAGDIDISKDGSAYTVSVDIPKKVSVFENDADYTPRCVLSTLLSGIVLSSDSYDELMPALGKIIEVFGGKLCIDFDEED